ncbi:hypothetical protein Sjap_006030 [Stephania japonica]|uniref:Pentatricopeptide repeat-containing protein At2g22410, mitochondrial-like n=1 Tax=Stephania japonica TaxID=461633 RepID=A0AAP0K569_9MAGN
MSQLKQIQSHMTRTGLITHTFPVSRLLSFCALSNSGDIDHARRIFDQIRSPNTYIWNTMIRGYLNSKHIDRSLALFRRMVREGAELDARSFVFALKSCEGIEAVGAVGGIFCVICKLGFDSETLIRNGLIHVYVKNGCLDFARQVFDLSPVRDVVSWTTMIDGYGQRGFGEEGIRVFKLMLLSGEVAPNDVTMIAALTVCSVIGDLSIGRWVHGLIEECNVEVTLKLLNSLVDMYAKCGCLNTARRVFNVMEVRDVYTWTSMIDGYAKQGDLELARRFFDEMPERNIVSWNAMIAGYSQKNRPKEALELFYKMEGVGERPVEGTLVCVLSACAQLGCFDIGRQIYNKYVRPKRVLSSITLGNAFIDMCAKCGNVDEASLFFNSMPERDLVTWNSMIVGYAAHGNANQALKLFIQLIDNGIKPDDITFVGVLSACSHGGLVEQGREYFKDMKRVFGIDPKAEHYACMIDLLGRVGHLGEAFDLIQRMPMKPDEAAWGALLNACRLHGNVDLGKLASHKLLSLNSYDSGIYVLLANMYASKRRWNDLRTVRSMMREKGVKKTPGFSSIEVDGKSCKFFVADKSNPQSELMYNLLDDMFLLLKLEGYVPDTSLHLLYHSP